MAMAAAIDGSQSGSVEIGGAIRRTVWGPILLLATILFLAGSIRLVITPLQQAAQVDIGLSDVQIATLKGLAQGMPGFLFALPLGLAIDHYNRVRLLLVLALVWTAGALLTPFAYGFTSLFIARALIALGVGGALGVATSLIADLCPPEKRGRIMVVMGIGVLAGPAFAFAGGGAIFGYFKTHGWDLFPAMTPWRHTTMIFAAISLALLVPVLLLREPVRHERAEHGNAILPALKGLGSRWRFLLPLWLGGTAGGLAEGAAGIWAAPMLTRNYGLQPDQFGAWMGVMILIAGVVGSVLGGPLADWGNARGRRGSVLIGAVAATVFTIPTAAYPIMGSPAGFGVMLGLMMLFCTVAQVITMTAITLLIPNEERGVCLALTSMAATLAGLGAAPLGPLLAPVVFGDTHHLPHMLTIMGMVTGTLALIGYAIAMRTAPESWRHA